MTSPSRLSPHCVTDGEHGLHWCPESVSDHGIWLEDICGGTTESEQVKP